MISPIPEPMQHRLCFTALTISRALLTELALPPEDVAEQSAKCLRWLDACHAAVNARSLGGAAKRAMIETFGRLADHMAGKHLLAENERRWRASLWCALTLLEDCRNTCPRWFRGREWRFALQTFATLCTSLLTRHPGMDEDGTALYLEVAAC